MKKPAHPLEAKAKLRPRGGPALDRRSEPRDPSERQRLTVQLRAGVIDRLRDAVFWTEGMTVARLVEECINRTVDQMEQQRGSVFPRREHDLRVGRPAKKS